MKSPNYKAIATDFDGVIVDSQPLHFNVWKEVITRLDLNIKITSSDIIGISVEDFSKSMGLSLKETYEISNLKQKILIEKSLLNPPLLYPNVAATLNILSSIYRLAIVSSAEPSMIQSVLAHYKLDKLFEFYITKLEYTNAKPSSEPYEICVKRFELFPQEIIAIEDSPLGIESALKAGLYVIGITNSYAKVNLSNAHKVINRFEELLLI